MFHGRRRLLVEVACLVLVVGLVAAYGARRAGRPPALVDHRLLMGTVVSITVYGADEDRGREAISEAFDEIARVERLASRYDPESALVRLNEDERRGREVAVDPELLSIIERAIEIAAMSDGGFDPTIAPLADLWPLTPEMELPSREALDAALGRVDYRRLAPDATRGTLVLPRDARLDLGGIATGYAVDRAIDVLRRAGIEAAIIDAGGDIGLLGAPPRGGAWRIGVKHPREDGMLGVVRLDGGSVTTSGDYQKCAFIGGVRYHHILDPSTGYPVRGIVSVTVTAERAIDADALATAVFAAGPTRGLELVEELPGVEAVIVTGDEEVLEVLVSSGLEGSFVEAAP